MCSVIGFRGQFDPSAIGRVLAESRVRGLHAFGYYAELDGNPYHLRTTDYGEFVRGLMELEPNKFIAHFRYSTSGDWRDPINNQPIRTEFGALAFNGVVHQGTKAEMEQEFGMTLPADNDGHVLAARLFDDEFLKRPNITYAAVYMSGGNVYAIRNRLRPLWVTNTTDYSLAASTFDILDRAGLTAAPVPTLQHYQL